MISYALTAATLDRRARLERLMIDEPVRVRQRVDDYLVAFEVAREHFEAARADGQSLADIMQSIGLKALPSDEADDVVTSLARAWLALRHRGRH